MSSRRIFAAGTAMPRRGHQGYLDPLVSCRSDKSGMIRIVQAAKHERARRELYSSCERAPVGWEK